MRLVDDDEIGRVAQELVALAIGLDEVDAGDEAARPAIDGEIPPGQLAFQPRHGRGLHDVGFERELVGELGLPLVAQMRWAQYGEPPGDAAVEQLARDQRRLDRLAHADIVGDQQAHWIEPQGQEQRDELVRPRRHRDPRERAERRGTRPEAEACGVEQREQPVGVAEPGGVGVGKLGGADRLVVGRNEDAGLLDVGAGERSKAEEP